ncbi:MAG: molybdopterin-dependent oxidoreductase, partial [Chloroflexi bacterium]|nr:molybdopterin-dependent oxidoreductase [Chloroflexota bacterium]
PVTDPREAAANGDFIAPPRTFSLGNTEDAWTKCDLIVEGVAESGGQEHLYLEMQGALATPKENGKMEIISSTQGPTAVQRAVAGILNLPMHKVEVDVLRLGGGFGGKEDQATIWACLAALAAKVCNKPVKLVLRRHEDMRMTGKRHPYSSDFKIGLSNDYKILAYEVQFYQNSGAAADLSTAILERTLFHATNSYFIPNVEATAFPCRTNLPPNTAFRGFGGPQGMFVMEAAIVKAAEKMGIDPVEIQKANLLNDGDQFPYGQLVKNGRAKATWDDMEKRFELKDRRKQIEKFNSTNNMLKKGLAVMPICFGISFTATFLNQANALVHVYTDGSVGISTGAVEMGQGVNMKMRQVAATIFSININ